MTHDERRLRNARNAYREWANERGRLESEILDLENKQIARRADGGRLSWQEQEHLNDLRDQARQLNRHTGTYDDLRERVNGWEQELRDSNGGTFEDWSRYNGRELAQRGDNLQRAADDIGNTIGRVGKGGKQPPIASPGNYVWTTCKRTFRMPKPA